MVTKKKPQEEIKKEQVPEVVTPVAAGPQFDPSLPESKQRYMR